MNVTESRRVLSSSSTWAYKYFWPGFNGAAFCAGSILIWQESRSVNRGFIWLGILALLLIGIVFVYFGTAFGTRLKHVEMDEHAMYVSNAGGEIRIPFSDIATCEVEWKGQRARLPIVTIHLRKPTAVGQEIVFLAALPWNLEHSIVAEIRQRRDRSAGAAPV